MSDETQVMPTRQKSLELNLDPLIYGSLAEIGAGQEVARHFFQAGGASGTVAKTVSAYDMNVSDDFYGADELGRYVTRARLESMLETEYGQVVDRLSSRRPRGSRFFAFADTVAAKSYLADRDCHGWMGIRFQHAPAAEHSQVVLHVRMLDDSNARQQDALGVLGVNLIHAAFFCAMEPLRLIEALRDNLVWGRIEVDLIHFDGPCFAGVDNLELNLALVISSLGPVAMFTPDLEAAVPAEMVHGKDVLIFRGVFRPFTDVYAEMIERGLERFDSEPDSSGPGTICLCEMNIARYLSEGLDEVSDLKQRVAAVCGRGYNVMVSSHYRYFRLSEYFSKHARRRIGFILSVDNVLTIFDDRYYEGMDGGILDAMARLMSSDTKLLVYPNLTADGEILTVANLEVPAHQKFLYMHLVHNRRIVPIEQAVDRLVPFEP
jgi:hypothetical protein